MNLLLRETLRSRPDRPQLHLVRWWKWALRWGRPRSRQLRLCESLPLGERRFVAVVEFEGARFLLGGTPSSLVLLSPLGARSAPCENCAQAAQDRPDKQ